MFILETVYTAPLEAVDTATEAHVTWLNELYEKGVFLASGRKKPRDGGVIIAVGEDRAWIEEVTANDPFVKAGVCTYRITEFVATKTAPALEEYQQTL